MIDIRKSIYARKVYKDNLTGNNIGIAILDTGAYIHKEIYNNIKVFKDYINNNADCYDDNGHGSHVAGIIAAKSFGIAPNASLIVLKVLDEKGRGESKVIIKCLKWILENYKRYNIRILNFSIGFTTGAGYKEQKEILELIEEIWNQGVVVVVAAGNNGPNNYTITVPGISRKVITVGSSEPNDFGSRGPNKCCVLKPEVLAPGNNIRSISNVQNEYCFKSGTSMSTPMVSGAIALALEKNNRLRPEQIKLMLYDSCIRTNNSKKYSWGTLNTDDLVALASK